MTRGGGETVTRGGGDSDTGGCREAGKEEEDKEGLKLAW